MIRKMLIPIGYDCRFMHFIPLKLEPSFPMETTDEERSHEDIGVVKVTECMAMSPKGFMIPEEYSVISGAVFSLYRNTSRVFFSRRE